MELIYKDVDELIPYVKNPRNNKRAVNKVASSIEEFGFKVPLVIDSNNVVICGHTRLLASKKLGLKNVPCIIADDLTEEQVKAFRLADNKVSEASEWNYDLLDEELAEIVNINMEDFGFEFIDPEEEHEKHKGQELRTDKAYNLMEFDPTRTEGAYQMPTLEPCNFVPNKLIGFNYALSTKDIDVGVHFYLDDYQFERVWKEPDKYIDLLSKFDCVFTPSYSVYMDMAEPLKIFNVFRSRLLGQMMQDRGMNVIPIVYWADERSYDYCFDGLPENATLSVYTMGTSKDEVWTVWKAGMDELIKRKHPKRLLIYGNGLTVDYDFKDIEVIYFKNEVTERMSNI